VRIKSYPLTFGPIMRLSCCQGAQHDGQRKPSTCICSDIRRMAVRRKRGGSAHSLKKGVRKSRHDLGTWNGACAPRHKIVAVPTQEPRCTARQKKSSRQTLIDEKTFDKLPLGLKKKPTPEHTHKKRGGYRSDRMAQTISPLVDPLNPFALGKEGRPRRRGHHGCQRGGGWTKR